MLVTSPSLDEIGFYERLREFPDHEAVQVATIRRLCVGPNVTVEQSDTPGGLRMILEGLVNRLISVGFDPHYLASEFKPSQIVEHEKSHANAALLAGFSTVRYVVSTSWEEAVTKRLFTRIVDRSIDIHPTMFPLLPTRPITKLALGSILAAPIELSQSDRITLSAMGYEGSFDVSERVWAFNQTDTAQPLMMPLAAR